jgi:parvulin-like peptidyl-prolyl isomerase
MEFLVEDAVDQAPPTEAELQAWLDAHAEAFRAEPRVGLRQVYLSTERRGASAGADAARLLARLRAAGPKAKTGTLGDASMLPSELPPGPLSEVSRTFGAEFAAKVEALPPGQWSGPIESAYGLHLVLVTERAAASRPPLADVRPLVERELSAERRKSQLQALYDRLLQKYTISIEMPTDAAKTAPVGGKAAGPGR